MDASRSEMKEDSKNDRAVESGSQVQDTKMNSVGTAQKAALSEKGPGSAKMVKHQGQQRNQQQQLQQGQQQIKDPKDPRILPISIQDDALLQAGTGRDSEIPKGKTETPLFDCLEIKSHRVEFTAEFCLERKNEDKVATMVLRVTRVTMEGVDMRRKLSQNETLDRLFRNDIGPDSFFFSVFGPEVHSSLPTFSRGEGQLTYEFRAVITLDGEYRLTLYMVSTNFSGIDEVYQQQRYRDFRLATQHNFTINSTSDWRLVERQLGKPSCEPGEETHNARWVFGRFTTGPTWRAPCLPECGRDPSELLVNGSWVPASKSEPVEGLQWVPSGCRLRTFTPREARECLHNKLLLFIGDSHGRLGSGRLISEGLGSKDITPQALRKPGIASLSTFCGRGFPCRVALKDGHVRSKGYGDVSYTMAGNASVWWLQETHPMGSQRIKSNGVQNVTIAFVNFGHWEAGGKTHFGFVTLDRYKANLERWFIKERATIDAGKFGSPTLVWTDTTPLLPMYPGDHWRENSRLALMNQEAAIIAQRYGYQVLEAFRVILPLAVATHDRSHYVFLQQDVLNHIRLNRACPLKEQLKGG